MHCLTDPASVCAVCKNSMLAGSRNRRRNTSLLVCFDDEHGARKHVIIDCGKSFHDSAITFLPQHGVRELAGVVITHDHADAMFGMDDLRMFTLHRHIQESIDVYLHEDTMRGVARVFGYLVNHDLATGTRDIDGDKRRNPNELPQGGGDVATTAFHQFDDKLKPFTIAGLEFQPFKGPSLLFLSRPLTSGLPTNKQSCTGRRTNASGIDLTTSSTCRTYRASRIGPPQQSPAARC